MRHSLNWLIAAGAVPSLLVLAFVPAAAEARVTRIQVTSRVVVADGMSFGDTGPYEKLRGTVYFAVDPNDSRNAVVFDLDKAPRNKDGLVEFSADMMIIKPVDMSLGNNRLLVEVPAHGGVAFNVIMNSALGTTNLNDPTAAVDFGNGWLLREGYSIALVGWQPDIAPGNNRLTVRFPIITENGQPIIERISTEFADLPGASLLPLYTAPLPYPSVSTDQQVANAELWVRSSDSPRPSGPEIPESEVVPVDQWSFAHCPTGSPGTPSTDHICVEAGFHNNLVYELRYRATNPTVGGLGYATTRDFISFLRNESADDSGNPNPLAGVTAIFGLGSSQSSQYSRDFLYEGFNEDTTGRRVFDGMHLRAQGPTKLALNYRFTQPDPGITQHKGRLRPAIEFPRAYAVGIDPVSGRLDGILKRPATDPKVVHLNGSTEYWQGRMSLLDTDEDGSYDVDQPWNVRRYFFSSLPHGAVWGSSPTYGLGNRQCQQLSNVVNESPLDRAIFTALDKWVTQGITPPPSSVARISDGTLVLSDQSSTGFPNIPADPEGRWQAVTYNGLFNASGERDFGPRVRFNSGVIDYLTPCIRSVHRGLVPRVNELGIDIAGIHHPFVEAPRATWTGWNLRRAEFTDGDLCDFLGMMIPLHTTQVDRLAAGDPRPSLEELYGTHQGYVDAVAKAAWSLWSQRLFLEEDVFQIIQEADESNVLR